jgi:hypothetical protein
MRIFHAFNNTHIMFSMELEKTDRLLLDEDMDGFENTNVRIMLPDTIKAFEDLHPDNWALIVVLALHPYITHSLTLSFPVSQQFANALPFNIYPIDFRLLAKKRRDNGLENSRVACPIEADPKSAFLCLIQDEHKRPDIFLHLSNWSEWHRPHHSASRMDSNFAFMEAVGLENLACRICLINTDIFSMFKSSLRLRSAPFVYLIGSVMCSDSLNITSLVLPVDASNKALAPLAMVTNLFAVLGIHLSLQVVSEADVRKGGEMLQNLCIS